MPDHYMDDIYSDISRKKQLEDAQKNKEFDRDMDAYRRGRNLTDEQRKKVLLDNARKKQLLGTQLLDNIEYGVTGSVNWLKKQAEEDPDRYTDDMLRLLGGGVKNVGWALSKVPFLDKIAQGEDWLAEQARAMSAQLTPQLDPRFAGWGTRVATGLIADKGIGKAYKVSKPLLKKSLLANINRTARPVYAMSDDVPQLARMFFSRSGLRDGVFDLNTWRQAGSDRNVMELFQTRWDQVAYRTKPGKQFTSTRKRLIKPFLEEHGNYLKKFDIDPSTIELHHIFGVNLSAPLYDGLRYGSKEWLEMTDELNRLGVFPGAPAPKGGTFEAAKKSNLMLVLEEPHDLLHRQFFKDRIGYFGEKFFTPEKMELLRSGQAGRLQVAKEYAEIIKQGETLIQRGMDQIQNVFGKTNISPEKLADAFSESLADGTTNIFKEGYKIESVNKVIKDLVFDIQVSEMITPLKQKAFGTIDDLKQEILLDKASGLSQKQLKKKYGKKFDIKQFDLFDQ